MPALSIAAKWTAGVATLALAALALVLTRQPDGHAPAANPPPATAAPVPPSPDGIALADAHAAAVRTPSAPGAWGGPRTGNEPTLSDRVVDYRIEARLDPEAHTIDGREQLTWRNRSAVEVRAVYLHLYLNGFEGEGSTFMSEKRLRGFEFRSDVEVKDGDWGHTELKTVQQQGRPVPWHFVHPDGGPATDHTVVRLDLPAPVAPGASTQLDITFFDQLPRVMARTGHFGSFHLVGQWFPKIAVLELPGERGATAPRWNAHEFHLHSEFYADYGRYDVSINVPDGYTVGATGEEVQAPVLKDGRRTHRFVQGDVHDFAWTADRRTAPPLTGQHTGPGSPTVKVRVLFPPEFAQSAPRVLQATIDALAYYSKTLGPYPYRTVTAVIPPFNAGEAGGMEYPTLFTTEGIRDVEPDTLQSHNLDFTTIHEFGHDYFYGILGSNEFEEPMLDEGLNEYTNQRMLRDRGQQITVTTPKLKRLGLTSTMAVFDFERMLAGLADPADGLGRNSWDRLSSGSFASVYTRGATAFRDLETRIGKPKMDQALQTYYQRWKFRHPSTADWRDVLAEVTGQPAVIDAFFAQHVHAASKLDDRVESFTSEEQLPLLGSAPGTKGWATFGEDQRDEQVAATRKAWKKAHPDAKPDDAGPFPYRTTVTLRRRGIAAPQTVVVSFADGSRETVVWDDDQRWKQFAWVKPAKAVSVTMDPQRAHAMDTSLVDNGRSLKADRRASRRLATDVGGLLQTVLALVATL